MIHARPHRRLGAALAVGLIGGSTLFFAQRPWDLQKLAPGPRSRLEAAGFGVNKAELRDAVNAGSTAKIVGPAPVMDAPPPVRAAVVRELPPVPKEQPVIASVPAAKPRVHRARHRRKKLAPARPQEEILTIH